MSDRTAKTEHPILKAITTRWSPRAFAPEPVDPVLLEQLFEAASWAASCFNEQPWRFIAAHKDDGETYEKILSCLVEFNQGWAKTAPVLFLAVASETFARNGKPNNHAAYDTGQAMATLAIEAAANGLQIHQMAGFDPEKARELFNIPEGFTPLTAAALGSVGEEETASRERKPPSTFVYGGTWGEPLG